MPTPLESLQSALEREFDGHVLKLTDAFGEITLEIAPDELTQVARKLRDHPDFQFEQLIDLCGVDYARYGNEDRTPPRFAVVYHFLSLAHNRRLRVRTFAQDDTLPVVRSVVEIWPSANWFEREAFDLFGIVFEGHPDLRRILTDYGFIGHPFRKDFPLSGNVEMRYDPDQQRVIYQPVTIEPREIVPRVTREENYGDVEQ
jgi:NADH-quinone oxidoreductase subunit C